MKRRTLLCTVLVLSFLLTGCFGKGKDKSTEVDNLLESAEKMANNDQYHLAAKLSQQITEIYPKESKAYIQYFNYSTKIKDAKIEQVVDVIQKKLNEHQKGEISSKVNEVIANYYLQQKDYHNAYYYYSLVDVSESETAKLYKDLSFSLASGNDSELQTALDAIISDTDKQKNTEEKVQDYQSLYLTIRSLDIEESIALNVLEKASSTANKIHEKNPDSTLYKEIELNLAEKYFELKDKVKAIQHYEIVYKLEETNITALEKLGELYMDGAQIEKAKMIYEKLVVQDPLNITSQSKLAVLLLKEELTKTKEQRNFSKILGIYSDLKLKENAADNVDYMKLKEELEKNNLLN